MSRGARLTAVSSGVAGVLLLLLALGLALGRSQVRRALVELDPEWLGTSSQAVAPLVGWAALAGGAWLLAVAWHRWRGEPAHDLEASSA